MSKKNDSSKPRLALAPLNRDHPPAKREALLPGLPADFLHLVGCVQLKVAAWEMVARLCRQSDCKVSVFTDWQEGFQHRVIIRILAPSSPLERVLDERRAFLPDCLSLVSCARIKVAVREMLARLCHQSNCMIDVLMKWDDGSPFHVDILIHAPIRP